MVYCVILEYRLFMAKPQVYSVYVASIVCWSVLLVVTDQMGRREGMKQVRLHLFCCAKGVVREKLAMCDRGLLLFGSDMQKGSFFNLVSDHGGVIF